MPVKSISNYLPAGLLLLAAALVGANWYFQPQRIVFWAVALLLIACLATTLFFISRSPSSGASAVRSSIVFAGLLLVIPLGVKLSTALGAIDHADFSRRAMMAIIGVFLMSTGNALPKTLTPLSVMRCDPAKAQTFQRFAGWTWVLTGLALVVVWLALPLHLADRLTFIVIPAGILIIALQCARLRWSRPSAVASTHN